jgi:hypothetical protein
MKWVPFKSLFVEIGHRTGIFLHTTFAIYWSTTIEIIVEWKTLDSWAENGVSGESMHYTQQ